MKFGRTLMSALEELDKLERERRDDAPGDDPAPSSEPLPPLRPGAFATWAARRRAEPEPARPEPRVLRAPRLADRPPTI
jgi:hypothetical protein